jgi:hypothetical protein
MTKIKYNNEQIQELLKNKYVKSCTSKNVNFTLDCKKQAILFCNKWLTTKEVFMKLWFPKYIINSNIPWSSINRWRKNIKKWNIEEQKWRPKTNKIDFDNMTQEQYIEYLETKLAYYEEMKNYINSWLP